MSVTIRTVTHVYVGKPPCGCIRAGCVDDPQFKKDTAEFCAEMVRRGYTLERIPIINNVRLGECELCKKRTAGSEGIR